MPTSWTTRTQPTTSWTTRSVPTTSWSITRLGGSYLTDVSGNYITDVSGNRIVVFVPGGTLPITSWTTRPSI